MSSKSYVIDTVSPVPKFQVLETNPPNISSVRLQVDSKGHYLYLNMLKIFLLLNVVVIRVGSIFKIKTVKNTIIRSAS